jgi:hypothetical protein
LRGSSLTVEQVFGDGDRYLLRFGFDPASKFRFSPLRNL